MTYILSKLYLLLQLEVKQKKEEKWTLQMKLAEMEVRINLEKIILQLRSQMGKLQI